MPNLEKISSFVILPALVVLCMILSIHIILLNNTIGWWKKQCKNVDSKGYGENLFANYIAYAYIGSICTIIICLIIYKFILNK